jgi:solute carrier family 25 folate transporter 32
MLTADRHATSTSEKRKHLLSGNAIAGVVGGFTSSLIMHPLDVVTTRMQAQDGRISSIPKYRNPIRALLVIARTEGFKRLYAGLVPNLVGSTTNWGIYFFGYNYSRSILRAFIQDAEGNTEQKELGPIMNLCCATVTGCISAIATQPIWLAKTRMELQQGSHMEYRGMLHCITTVVQKEGTSALFRF